MSEQAGSVTALDIFPIKSCHAATVDNKAPERLHVGMTGLEAHGVADREYVIIEENPDDEDTAHFVTQRGWGPNNRLDRAKQGDSKLATVRTDLSPGTLRISTTSTVDGRIELDTTYDASRPLLDVSIFGKQMLSAVDQGREAATFFSDLLGRSVRLVRANRQERRTFKPKYHVDGAVNVMAGADGFPILLTNQASLDYSHQVSELPLGSVSIRQYRGNIMIDGSAEAPYDEDYWRELRIGALSAFVVKACDRCPMPNINQETGERGAGGQTVLRHRRGQLPGDDTAAVFFGANLNHVYTPDTVVQVGDPIEVVRRSEERNFNLVA